MRVDTSSFFSHGDAMTASSSAFSMKNQSTGASSDDAIPCEICTEPFCAPGRLPKLLPCGHTFCEACLTSVYFHHNYYDCQALACPTCRRRFAPSAFLSAPTNFDLMKLIERRAHDGNITVIRLIDEQPAADERSMVISSTATTRKTRKEATIRCRDCNKRLGEKHIARTARSCAQCNVGKYLELSCLECCVDVHNGHTLVARSKIEEDQARASVEQSRLLEMAADMAKNIRAAHQQKQSALSRLCTVQEATVREALSDLAKGRKALESYKLLSATMLEGIRHTAMQHVAKLSTICKVLESEAVTMRIGGSGKLLSGSQLRQSRLRVRDGEGLARESLAGILSILPHSSQFYASLSSLLASISPKDRWDDRLRNYVAAVVLIAEHLGSTRLAPSALPVISDALVHLAGDMDALTKKWICDRTSGPKELSRLSLWSAIFAAFTQLMRLVAKNYSPSHAARVDVIDDLAYVCTQYWDVAEHQTLTMCDIEVTRARAANADGERLARIEEHLAQCRRMQRMEALRQPESRTRGIARFFKSCVSGGRTHE